MDWLLPPLPPQVSDRVTLDYMTYEIISGLFVPAFGADFNNNFLSEEKESLQFIRPLRLKRRMFGINNAYLT